MSSLLGVWQSVPYLFADLCGMLGRDGSGTLRPVDTRAIPYRGFLIFLGTTSIVGLLSSFVQIQKIYAILGALFIPMLAVVLLILNSRGDLVGRSQRNGISTQIVLVATLVLFVLFGLKEFGPWR